MVASQCIDGTQTTSSLLVHWRNDLFSPVNVITSSLLGGEIVRFIFQLGRNPKTRKCLYLSQKIELRKI